MLKILAFFSLLMLMSCQSAITTQGGNTAAVSGAKSSRGSSEDSQLKGRQISDGVGENSEPSFSPAGQLLVFVSRKRPEHPQAQVYELNLATARERRLTFQNGDTFAPAFHPDGKLFFYASNTDRLKEESYYLDNLKNIYSPKTATPASPAVAVTDFFDYYSSGLDGRNIDKIGSPVLRSVSRAQTSVAISPDGKHLAVSAGGLWVTNLNGFEARRLSTAAVSHARFSPDGKSLVWSETTVDGGRLMTRALAGSVEATILLSSPGAHDFAPNWNPKNPNEIIFSSDRGSSPLKKPQFDLYVLELEAKCLKRLTETPTIDETDPVFKPDGSAIAFTSTSGGSPQIYTAEYKSPAACLPLTP